MSGGGPSRIEFAPLPSEIKFYGCSVFAHASRLDKNTGQPHFAIKIFLELLDSIEDKRKHRKFIGAFFTLVVSTHLQISNGAQKLARCVFVEAKRSRCACQYQKQRFRLGLARIDTD